MVPRVKLEHQFGKPLRLHQGNYIGTDMITIPGDSTADAEIDWDAVGGTHTIKVIVDEENATAESDEDKNEAEEDIDVNYPPILVVDDDNSDNNGGTRLETDTYYIDSLKNMSSPVGYEADASMTQRPL